MNVNDVETTQEAPQEGSKLVLIFARQRELMEKYEVIEAANGLLQTPDIPVDLNDARGQARLKDFAWRITEELAEAMDAFEEIMNNPPEEEEGSGADFIHIQEELMDAFHFLVEMAILSGITPEKLLELSLENPAEDGKELPEELKGKDLLEVMDLDAPKGFEPDFALGQMANGFIHSLGMTCHLLKCKPWKQTQMVTDIKEYQIRFLITFAHFIQICFFCGMDAQSIFDIYFKKSRVNGFRIRSNY